MSDNIQDRSMLRIGTILHDTYRIDRYLSSGGFGNTYVATNIAFDERVAIKEFFIKGVNQRDENQTTVSVSNRENVNQFEEQREKFKKEARRLRRLYNDHLVRVHDLFEENGTAYYVMDFVDGETLSERLKRTGKPLDEAEVWKILPQILDALKAVHHKNIWHLDLKPGNIMLDRQGMVKLIDFGASKQLNVQKGGATSTTAVSYTRGYAPKEQEAQHYDKFGAWTDLYALGATLYNLVSNHKPPMSIDIEEDGEAVFAFPVGVSAKMRQLVLWLMQPNRMKRPQSVEEIEKSLSFKPEPQNEETKFAEKAAEKPAQESDETQYTRNNKTGAQQSEKTEYKQPEHTKQPEQKPDAAEPEPKKRSKKWWLIGMGAVILCAMIALIALKSGKVNQEPLSNRTFTVNGVSFKMVGVQGGTFQMGSNDYDSEKPVHSVTLSSYYIGQTEVTQALWKAVMGSYPSYFKGYNLPVEQVSWNDCQTFIQKLNQLTGENFRLPTEAEWEFAAKGGKKSKGYIYSGSNEVDDVAWCDEDYDTGGTHPVVSKSPNELGIYDMSGNVHEWCQDWYGSYSNSAQTSPTGPASGSCRVFRGGSWDYGVMYCCTANRAYEKPTYTDFSLGLRLALSE